jgi:hypothetical protein
VPLCQLFAFAGRVYVGEVGYRAHTYKRRAVQPAHALALKQQPEPQCGAAFQRQRGILYRAFNSRAFLVRKLTAQRAMIAAQYAVAHCAHIFT